jgi:hypothetical protein
VKPRYFHATNHFDIRAGLVLEEAREQMSRGLLRNRQDRLAARHLAIRDGAPSPLNILTLDGRDCHGNETKTPWNYLFQLSEKILLTIESILGAFNAGPSNGMQFGWVVAGHGSFVLAGITNWQSLTCCYSNHSMGGGGGGVLKKKLNQQ